VLYLESQLPQIRQEMADGDSRLENLIEDAIGTVESHRKDELRQAVHLEELGILLFAVGLLVSTLGTVG
jgi:hypothetical protein